MNLEFYTINKNLRDFELYSISSNISDEQLQSYKNLVGLNNAYSVIESTFKNEIDCQIFKIAIDRIIKFGTNEFVDSTEGIKYDDVLDKIISVSYINEYNNIIISNSLFTILSDSHRIKFFLDEEIRNTNGNPFKVATIDDINIWTDPYMKWDDKRIFLFDKILMNKEVEKKIIENPIKNEITARAKLFIKIEKSSYIDIIEDSNSELYFKYIRQKRDESISQILT